MRSPAVSIAWLLLAIGGCSPAHQRGLVEDPCLDLDPTSFACAMAWVAAFDRDRCRMLRECDGVSISDELCDAYYPAEGAWETIETERNHIAFEEGRVRFDADGVRCILEHAARCDQNPYDEPAACPPMWVATAPHAEGDACGSRFECGPGMACTDPRQRCGVGLGTCVRLAAEGEACATAPETGRGCDGQSLLTCVDHRCARVTARVLGGLGAQCNTVTAEQDGGFIRRDCAAGLGCDMVVEDSHCIIAAPCGESSCAPFTACVDGACVAIATPRPGDACGSGQGLCSWGSFGLVCDEETFLCVATHRRLGEPCADSWAPCIEGVCRFEPGIDGGGTHRCGPERLTGEPCLRDVECESHACCEGTCGG